MQRIISLLLIGIVAALVVTSSTVVAQPTPQSTTSLTERLNATRQLYPFTLDDAAKQAIRDRCFAVQEKLRVMREGVLSREATRESIYRRIDARLSALQKRFSAQQIDTSILDLLLANYRKDLALYVNAATLHQVALNDGMMMDCGADPELFRSQIEAIRASNQKMNEEIVKIDALLVNNLPSALDGMKERVANGN